MALVEVVKSGVVVTLVDVGAPVELVELVVGVPVGDVVAPELIEVASSDALDSLSEDVGRTFVVCGRVLVSRRPLASLLDVSSGHSLVESKLASVASVASGADAVLMVHAPMTELAATVIKYLIQLFPTTR